MNKSNTRLRKWTDRIPVNYLLGERFWIPICNHTSRHEGYSKGNFRATLLFYVRIFLVFVVQLLLLFFNLS